ncbi:hypothetical protein ACFPRL_22475 [Pseudoclavibacter helvolus]
MIYSSYVFRHFARVRLSRRGFVTTIAACPAPRRPGSAPTARPPRGSACKLCTTSSPPSSPERSHQATSSPPRPSSARTSA